MLSCALVRFTPLRGILLIFQAAVYALLRWCNFPGGGEFRRFFRNRLWKACFLPCVSRNFVVAALCEKMMLRVVNLVAGGEKVFRGTVVCVRRTRRKWFSIGV